MTKQPMIDDWAELKHVIQAIEFFTSGLDDDGELEILELNRRLEAYNAKVW